MPARQPLTPLMSPQSVAIIGANPDPEKIGGAPLKRLLDFGYSGRIYPVSRSHSAIAGVPCVRAVSDLPKGIDVALLAVPQRAAVGVLAELGKLQTRSAIVYASGFSETGPEGDAEQKALIDAASDHGMLLAGPNCLGLVNFVDRVPLTFSALSGPTTLDTPGVSIVSQSGAMAMAMTYAARAQGARVAYTVSTGNEAMLSMEDYLPYLVSDPMTQVIVLLIEQVRYPARFLAEARRARLAGKPVLALKTGRTAAGQQAALSHTGALAGDYATVEAVLGAEGVVLFRSIDDLIDAAAVLVNKKAPHPGGVALVSESGALKTLAIDLAHEGGVPLAELAPSTVRRLEGLLPPFAVPNNPVDITGQALAQPALYGDVAQALLDDPNVGCLITATMPGTDRQTTEQADALVPVLEHAVKPVIHAFSGGQHPVPANSDARLIRAGVPVLLSVERALRAAGAVEQWRRLSAWAASREEPAAITTAAADGTPSVVNEHASKEILGSAGIATPRATAARDVREAVAAARQLGYPVVAKGISDLVHKTEHRAVVVGVPDEAQLIQALEEISDGIAAAGSKLEGFLVEEMAGKGIDLIIGAKRVDAWGTVILVGIGGVAAESIGDTALVPVGAPDDQIRFVLSTLRSAPLLTGLRGEAPADLDDIVRVVSQVSALMQANPGYQEIDVNPYRVFGAGLGGVALDATIIGSRGSM